jgi:hypothetical protein
MINEGRTVRERINKDAREERKSDKISLGLLRRK